MIGGALDLLRDAVMQWWMDASGDGFDCWMTWLDVMH